MKARDWAIVGARLLAIYFLAQAVNALQEFGTLALQNAPASVYGSDLAGTLVFGLGAVWIWMQAPLLADAIASGTQDRVEEPRPADAGGRTALVVGLSVAGLFLAGTAIQPLIGNLWRVIQPAAPIGPGAPLEAELRKESAAFAIAALAKMIFGIVLFRRARTIAARADLPSRASD